MKLQFEPSLDYQLQAIGTDLELYLRRRGIASLVVVGLTTDHCVSSTARLAGGLGFETYVVADATAAFEMESHDGRRFSAEEIHAVALVNLQGEFAAIVSTGRTCSRRFGTTERSPGRVAALETQACLSRSDEWTTTFVLQTTRTLSAGAPTRRRPRRRSR